MNCIVGSYFIVEPHFCSKETGTFHQKLCKNVQSLTWTKRAPTTTSAQSTNRRLIHGLRFLGGTSNHWARLNFVLVNGGTRIILEEKQHLNTAGINRRNKAVAW